MYEDAKKDSDVFVSDKGRAGNVSSLYSKKQHIQDDCDHPHSD